MATASSSRASGDIEVCVRTGLMADQGVDAPAAGHDRGSADGLEGVEEVDDGRPADHEVLMPDRPQGISVVVVVGSGSPMRVATRTKNSRVPTRANSNPMMSARRSLPSIRLPPSPPFSSYA